MTRIIGTSHEDLHTLMTKIFRWVLLRIRTVLDKVCREKKTHFRFDNFFLKLLLLWDNLKKKYVEAGQITVDNTMPHRTDAIYMQHT